MIYVFKYRGSSNKIYSSNTQIKPKSREISFVLNKHSNYQIVLKIWTKRSNDAAVLHVNFKMIWQRNKSTNWTNEISRNLSLGCISDGRPILQSPITITSLWGRWRLKSPASRLFAQSFIQAQIKQKHQSSASLAFVGELTGDPWIPHTKGQWRGKCFHLMTSSCSVSKVISFMVNHVDSLHSDV